MLHQDCGSESRLLDLLCLISWHGWHYLHLLRKDCKILLWFKNTFVRTIIFSYDLSNQCELGTHALNLGTCQFELTWSLACEEVALWIAATINLLTTLLLHYWRFNIEGALVLNSKIYWMNWKRGSPQNRGTLRVGWSGGSFNWVVGYFHSSLKIIAMAVYTSADYTICGQKNKIHILMSVKIQQVNSPVTPPDATYDYSICICPNRGQILNHMIKHLMRSTWCVLLWNDFFCKGY